MNNIESQFDIKQNNLEMPNNTTLITFQLTDACNLRCTYCYQENKQNNYLTKEIADLIIDKLFPIDETFFTNYFQPDFYFEKDGNKYLREIILDFIGGEPLLHIDMINYICVKIFNIIEKEKLDTKVLSIDLNTNGTLMKNRHVINFCKKFREKTHINYYVTLDGCKKAHDACRKDINGNGSFDKVIEGYNIIRKDLAGDPTTRLTLSPQNLPYLYESFLFLVEDMGFDSVNALIQKEDVWSYTDVEIYIDQLVKISNYLLNHDNIEYVALENSPIVNGDFCGSCGLDGSIISFDAKGNVFNCFRYSECTTNSKEILDLGNIKDSHIKKATFNFLKKFIGTQINTDEHCQKCSERDICDSCPSFNYQHGNGKDLAQIPIVDTYCNMLHAEAAVKEEYLRCKRENQLAKTDFKSMYEHFINVIKGDNNGK